MSFVQKHYLYFILSFFAVSRKWVILRPLMLCICFFYKNLTDHFILHFPNGKFISVRLQSGSFTIIWNFFHQGNQKTVLACQNHHHLPESVTFPPRPKDLRTRSWYNFHRILANQLFFLIMLILDVSDNFFQDILHGYRTGCLSIFIYHYDQMALFCLHFLEKSMNI